jgi:cytochrome c oxidase subunit II
MTELANNPGGHDRSEQVERRWATIAIIIVSFMVVLAAFAGIHQAVMPQTRIETVDPRTLHVAGEFIESNLGSAVEADGSVTVRAVGQQYSFTPQCIVVPTDTPVTFRATSADVVHGFLIEHSNINTMLVPEYISMVTTRFSTPAEVYMPCHEFCGVGHEGMWARIKIVDKAAFQKLAADRRRVDCVTQ